MCYYFLVHQWKKQIHGNSSWVQQKWYLQLTWRWKPDTRWLYAVRIADSEGNGTDYVYNLDIAQYVFSLPKWKIWKIIYLKQLPLRYRCDTVAIPLQCSTNWAVKPTNWSLCEYVIYPMSKNTRRYEDMIDHRRYIHKETSRRLASYLTRHTVGPSDTWIWPIRRKKI